MITKKKARPTEYRGTRFASKSEAILARNFSLLDVAWEYEPPVPGEWSPDFYLFGACTLFRFGMYLEYKPRGCTETYKKELGERYAEIQKEQRANGGDSYMFNLFTLLCFSPYERKPYDLRELEMYAFQDGIMRRVSSGEINGDALLGKIDEAMDYRFDLDEEADDLPYF